MEYPINFELRKSELIQSVYISLNFPWAFVRTRDYYVYTRLLISVFDGNPDNILW